MKKGCNLCVPILRHRTQSPVKLLPSISYKVYSIISQYLYSPISPEELFANFYGHYYFST